MSDIVLYAAAGKVGIVTLNRPAKLNAMTMASSAFTTAQSSAV